MTPRPTRSVGRPPRRPAWVTLRSAVAAIVTTLVVVAALLADPGYSDVSDAALAINDAGASYAALGDSFSSGEGTAAYLPGTAVPGTNVCHRSSLAYSGLLDADLGLGSLGFVACSGAVTADLFGANSNGNLTPDGQPEPAQLCGTQTSGAVGPCGTSRAPVLGSQTLTVTVTIGGNDLGFARLVRGCVFATASGYDIGDPGRGCRQDPLITGPFDRRFAALDGVGSNVQSAYGTTIHSWTSVLAAVHRAAPNAHVYIAGYPHLFQPDGTTDCVVGSINGTVPVQIGANDAAWVDQRVDAVDKSISLAAFVSGRWATFVDPRPSFTGHGLCGTDPWFNPVLATLTLGRPSVSAAATTVDLASGSLHPTTDGQKQGYAPAFSSAIDGS